VKRKIIIEIDVSPYPSKASTEEEIKRVASIIEVAIHKYRDIHYPYSNHIYNVRVDEVSS